MKLSSFTSAVLLMLLFCGACSSSPKPLLSEGMYIKDDLFGIVHAGRTEDRQEMIHLNRLGVKWTLRTFNWTSIETRQDEWDFDYYDAYVDRLIEEGIEVVGLLAYDHWWNNDDQKSHRNITPLQLPGFIEYVSRTAEHFKGRVKAWCIWNEPNTAHFWKGSAEDFYALTKGAADAIRKVDPGVIIMGGAFNRGVFGLQEKFIRGLFESGAMEQVDAVAFHPYELNPARTLTLYRKFKKLVDDYGFGDKIWITEVGYPTGGWYPTKINEKKFPEYVVKTMINLTVAGTSKILWYQLFDPVDRNKNNSEDFFALTRSVEDYTSKGAEAFRLCVVYLAGTVYRLDLPVRERSPASLKTYYFERPGGEGGTLVMWKESGHTQVKVRFPDGGSFTAHDPVTGTASTLPSGSIIRAGTVPVFITWQGNRQPQLTR